MCDLRPMNAYAREEVTEVMRTSPGNSVPPALLRRFRNNSVINFVREVGLRIQRVDSLTILISSITISD